MIAFDPNGPILSVTAPGSTQITSGDQVNNNMALLINTDSTNDAIVGWGQTVGAAQFAAQNSSTSINCIYLLHATQFPIPVIIPTGSFVFVTPVAGTPTVKIQAGISVR